MTESTHIYSAVLTGSPDVTLNVRGGRINFDDSRAPHVSASITIAVPALAVLTALDPRANRRIRITATSDLPGVTARTFDLSLRERTTRLEDALVSLELASDEALADDYAQAADDLGAFSRQSSLRSIVNYVLGKSIPGAVLASLPAADVDASTYSDSRNLIPDPSNEGGGSIFNVIGCTPDRNDTSWAAHGSKSINLYAPTSAASWLYIGGDTGGMRLGMQAGRTYMFRCTGRIKATLSGNVDQNARRVVVFYKNAAGTYVETKSAVMPTTVGTVTDLSVVFTIPAGATEAFIRCYLGHDGTNSQIQYDAFRLSEWNGEDPTDTGFYSGSTANSAGYVYGWEGAANASPSYRTAIIDRPPAALRWKAGQSAMDFLASVVQPLARRLVCDETRSWTLRDENYEAPGSLAVRHGFNLIGGTDKVRRDDTWCDAALVTWKWEDANGTHTATDFYAATTPYTRLKKVELTTAYSGPGYAAYIVRRSQGRGREVTATIVSDWRARAEQPVEVTLDGAPIQTGRLSTLEFDLDTDELTITTRSVDTPPSAWVLIPVGSRWIDQPVGGSWIGEVV